MRIAIFTECYRPIVNGVVVSVETFTEELRRLGHDLQIIAPGFPGYTDTGPGVYRLPSWRPPVGAAYPLALPFTGNRLRPLFTAAPPDIIHAQHPFTTGREARRWARRLKRPLLFTYHTLIREYAHYIPLPQPLVRAAAVRLSRTFSNSADQVIVPTTAIAQVLRSYGVTRPITAIPTGIDLTLLRGTRRTPVRAQAGLSPDLPLIAYSGRIAQEKGLDRLLTALAQLAARGSEAHLVLIGGGPWEHECRRLVAAAQLVNRVHLTGYVPRETVFDWLAEADVYCFPSLTDTQGVAVLEAMALGCPPVAARSGAIEDVIRSEVDGLIVDPSAEALAAGLQQLLDDAPLRQRLGDRARLRAADFSADRMALRLLAVYEECLRA